MATATAAAAAGGAMDFHSLPRRDLQALCKKNRIPANMTNVAMADALRALTSVEGMDELHAAIAAGQFLSPQKTEATVGADAPRTSRRTTARKLPVASVEPKEQQASPLPRSRRVTAKVSEIMRLVTEGEGDKAEEKDLGFGQVVPQTPAAPMAKETASRTTRRRATRKEEASELDGAMDAITKTPATRTAGRRTTTRKAVATSAPVDEGKEEQMVPPSRTTRRTRQASKLPAGDSIAATATLRRSTRARGGVSKMAPLAAEEGCQQEKDAETVDSLDSETKLEESDVLVQEKNNSDAEICPSVADGGNQILEEIKDEKQEQSVEDKDSKMKNDDLLADNKISEGTEENIEDSSGSCGQGHVAEVEAICQGEEEINQADNSLSVLEGSPVLGLVSHFEDLVIGGDKQGMQDEDKSLVLQEATDVNVNLLVGEKLSSVDLVKNSDVAGVQSVQDEDNSLELGGAIDADAVDMPEVQEKVIGNVSLEEISESRSDILVDGSNDNIPNDLEINPHSDDTVDEADSSPASMLNLTGSTVEILAEKADRLKDEAFTETENTTENHDQTFEAEEEVENNAGGENKSVEQKNLSEYSIRKLKSLLKQKMSNDNQKVDKKRPALTQLNENCLQRTSEE